MKDVKVSVIMPMLNVEPYIRQCIESVIYQTLKEIEILCVDAGNTDGTLEIIQEFAMKDSRIRIINSPIKSYGYQMNLGIEAAYGEYIGIVETDDYVDNDMFEGLLSLSHNGSIDIIKSNFYNVYCDRTEKDFSRAKLPEKKAFSLLEQPIIIYGHPSIWTAIYRKAFLEENGIRFKEIPGAGWSDNPFFFETISCAKSIIWTKHCYYHYNRFILTSSTNSIENPLIPIERMLDNLDIIEKYGIRDESVLYLCYRRILDYVNKSLAAAERIGNADLIEKTGNIVDILLHRVDERILNSSGDVIIIFEYYRLLFRDYFNGKSFSCNDGIISSEKLEYINNLASTYTNGQHKVRRWWNWFIFSINFFGINFAVLSLFTMINQNNNHEITGKK